MILVTDNDMLRPQPFLGYAVPYIDTFCTSTSSTRSKSPFTAMELAVTRASQHYRFVNGGTEPSHL